MNRQEYVDKENWLGSYYELALEFFPGGNDTRLLKAMSAVWNLSELQGPWENIEEYSSKTKVLHELAPDKGDLNRLYGLLRISTNKVVGCQTITIREEEGSDWLLICIPTGMLDLIGQLDHGNLHKGNSWLREVDDVLVKIASEVYNESHYNLATIGEEVSGDVYSCDTDKFEDKPEGLIIPTPLSDKFKSDSKSVELINGLVWFPYIRT